MIPYFRSSVIPITSVEHSKSLDFHSERILPVADKLKEAKFFLDQLEMTTRQEQGREG